MRYLLRTFALFIAASALSLRAADPAPKPPVLEISTHPAPAAEPALRYRLVPVLAERTRGDAAPLYLMAFLQLHLTDGEQKQLDDLLAAPREKFSAEGAGQILQSRQQYLANLELAALRRDCHWEIPWREHGVATLLPHLQPCRQATRMLALQARMQISQGRFDDAVHTLQVGFALVDHLKNEALLIQGLVSIAITHVLLERVVELQQTPASPNMYWALAGLPHPLIDVPAMTELERGWVLSMLPELKGRNVRELSAETFSSVLARIGNLMTVANIQEPAFGQKLAAAAMIAMQLPSARVWLQSHGYTEKQVNDLPPISAVGIYLFELYQHTADDMFKWTSLPYWQARDALARSETMLRTLQAQGPNPALVMLPAMSRIMENVAVTDRRIAMLQTVEALRGYAAAHEGKLPAALADLTEMPAPVDPMTGKPFEYEVAGNTAILRSLAVLNHTGMSQAGTYRITLTGKATP